MNGFNEVEVIYECPALFGWPNTAPLITHHQWRQNTRLTHTSTYTSFPLSSAPSNSSCKFLDTPRLPPTLQPARPDKLPPTYRLVTPSLRLLSCILLVYVRPQHALSPAGHVTISSCIPLRSLPKKGLPFQEIALALVASILGGFGTVAMFCTLGVYV